MEKQLLHLVFGGELEDPSGTEFVDTGRLDIVGIFPNYRKAYEAWRANAQQMTIRADTDLGTAAGPDVPSPER